jgi:hypothetical protein
VGVNDGILGLTDMFGGMGQQSEGSRALDFPDDDNGDALRRLQAAGDDLSRSRNIEFTVVFPTQVSAERFAEHFRVLGYATSIDPTETVPDNPWDVVVVKHMEASHAEIGGFEDLLESVAHPLGGRNDGWGCFSEADQPSTLADNPSKQD